MKVKATQPLYFFEGSNAIVARKNAVIDVCEVTAEFLVESGWAELVDGIKEEKKAVRKPYTRKAAKVEK